LHARPARAPERVRRYRGPRSFKPTPDAQDHRQPDACPTVSLSLTQTPSPTPTPTPAPAEEPEERYALKDAFPRIDGFRYRDVPARILRSIVRRWRNRMGDARTVLDGPRVRYLIKRRLIAATAIAFAARAEGARFGTFARAVLREGSGREGSAAAGPGTGARGVLRRAGRGLWEIALIRRNLLVAVVAVDRGTAERIGRRIGRSLE
jgi:hypothetical protein